MEADLGREAKVLRLEKRDHEKEESLLTRRTWDW